ncbi:unnamed protein product, partial [Sphacelaria rigidula]
ASVSAGHDRVTHQIAHTHSVSLTQKVGVAPPTTVISGTLQQATPVPHGPGPSYPINDRGASYPVSDLGASYPFTDRGASYPISDHGASYSFTNRGASYLISDHRTS